MVTVHAHPDEPALFTDPYTADNVLWAAGMSWWGEVDVHHEDDMGYHWVPGSHVRHLRQRLEVCRLGELEERKWELIRVLRGLGEGMWVRF